MTRIRARVLPGGGPVLAYEVGGNDDGARPLVLLHGLSANSTSWAPVTERTARDWRSYALDFRGHGRSDRTPGRYRLDDYIDDADHLLQMIGQPAIVAGHSLGDREESGFAMDRNPQAPLVVERHRRHLAERVLAVEHPAVRAGEQRVGHVAQTLLDGRVRTRRRPGALDPLPTEIVRDRAALERALTGYHLWHAVRARMLRLLGRRDEAMAEDLRALELTANDAERRLLAARVDR